jgi:hypothetical protein
LPAGWQERLISICNENTRLVTARCLEPHDLAVSKLVAGREKDCEFIAAMCRHEMIREKIIIGRISQLAISAEEQMTVRERWQRIKDAATRMEG